MMKREFTRREKALLLALAVVLLLTGYLKLFLEPVKEQYAAARTRYSSVQDALTREQSKLADIKKMKKTLKKQRDSSGVADITIPSYDNSDNVMVQLDKILGSAVNYQVTFSDVVYGANLVSRPLKLTFTAGNYTAAREILADLYSCRYRCALSEITVSSDGDDGNLRSGSVRVSLTVTFYEKLDKAAKQDQAAAADRKTSSAG